MGRSNLSSVLGLGQPVHSFGEGNGSPLQCSCLELRSLVGCSPWGRYESDTTEWLHCDFSLSCMEKAMAPHSSALAWKIPWMEEPGGLQSMGSWRVGHDWVTSLSLFIFMHWRRNWQPTPVFLPGESQGWGSLVGCCLWGPQSRTQLKWLSSSSAFLLCIKVCPDVVILQYLYF